MSGYREKLQKMMLDRSVGVMECGSDGVNSLTRPLTHSLTHPLTRFYTVCEFAADALFLAGWAVLIIGHI